MVDPNGEGKKPPRTRTLSLGPKRRAKPSAAPTTPDPVEIAMEASAKGDASADTRAVLRGQAALFNEQIGLARNERFRNRIKAVRDLALSIAVLALIGGAGAALWTARQATGLVVEPLTVPPDFAAQGMNGTVLAGRLLDRLSAMQAATDSSRAPATFGNNWGDDLSVEVPETGMSAGEIWRMTRQTLGHETRLSGDLVSENGRLILTTRVGANPGASFEGGQAELDRLLDGAAQTIYRQAQPYRYAVWLNRHGEGGNDEILRQLAASGDRTEQLWARVGLSVNAYRTDPDLALALAREALAIDPSFHKARWNVSDALAIMGRREEDLREQRLIERAMSRRDPRVTKIAQDQVLHNARGNIAESTGDLITALNEAHIRAALPDYADNASIAHYTIVSLLTALHDRERAMAALVSADRSVSPRPELSAFVAALAAEERGDLAAAASFVRTALLVGDEEQESGWLPEQKAAMALILVRSGDGAAGASLIRTMRNDCYVCVITRGKLAAHNGDFALADRLMQRAAGMGPSLPDAWFALGRLRLDRGDKEGAITAFSQAARLAPRWADPLKGWGDALAAAGDHRDAIRKYAEAAERAPRWGALQTAWGRSLEADGKRPIAAEKYRSALRMSLTAAERAEANRHLGSR